MRTFGPSLNSASHTRAVVSAGRLVQKRHRYQSVAIREMSHSVACK
jgi:hypothetical protein